MPKTAYENAHFYNAELKEQFIEKHSESSRPVYSRIFYHSRYTEELYDTDLYDFNLDQISDVIRSLNPTSLTSVRNIISIIKSYIDDMIAYRTNNLNPLDGIDTKWMRDFINNDIKLYYSKEELDNIINDCDNAQDACIITALFDGIGGKGLSELRNLTPYDIDYENNTVTLTNDDGEKRTLVCSDQTIKLLKDAIDQTMYVKRNGHVSENARNGEEAKLLETGFVIKPIFTRNKHKEQVDVHVIYRRLANVAETLGLENFTAKNIQRSGMIYMAKQILERDGHFDEIEQYYEICRRFGMNKLKSGIYEYNWQSMKEYVNLENIQKLYGINEDNVS
jgi:integrase